MIDVRTSVLNLTFSHGAERYTNGDVGKIVFGLQYRKKIGALGRYYDTRVAII